MYKMVCPVTFHYFSSDEHPSYASHAITPQKFKNIIEAIGIENILSPDEWLRKHINRTLRYEETMFCLDDGLKCQYQIALPIMEQYGIRALWGIYKNVMSSTELGKYIQSQFPNDTEFYTEFFKLVDGKCFVSETEIAEFRPDAEFYTYDDRKYRVLRNKLSETEYYDIILKMLIGEIPNLCMSETEIRRVSETQCIAIHLETTRLEQYDIQKQRKLFGDCRDYLELIIGKQVDIVTYPCGTYTNDTLEIMEIMKISYAFTDRINYEETIYTISRADVSNIF